MELKIEYLPIKKITPYRNNARAHGNDDVQAIVNSIKEFGFDDPLGVWGDENVIIEGHGRLMAAKKLKMKEVPVIRLDHLTDEQRRAYALAHNKTAELSMWDFDLLSEELEGITDIDMSDFGFDLDSLEDEEEVEVEEVETPEPPKEPKTKPGDLYKLGEHRLICGDCTDVNVIERLMDGVKPDLLMTDPPYGIEAEKMTMGKGKKAFYRGADWDSDKPDLSHLLMIAPYSCIWGGNYYTDILPITNDWLIWHKKNDGRSFSECELAWTNYGVNTRHLSHHWGGEEKLHVTMKPLKVIEWAVKLCPDNPKIILDSFGGSGSTMMVCEQLGKVNYSIELDPKYCDVIIERWEKLTGKTAELLENGE